MQASTKEGSIGQENLSDDNNLSNWESIQPFLRFNLIFIKLSNTLIYQKTF